MIDQDRARRLANDCGALLGRIDDYCGELSQSAEQNAVYLLDLARLLYSVSELVAQTASQSNRAAELAGCLANGIKPD